MKRKLKLKNLIILVLSVIFLIGFVRQQSAINRIQKNKQNQKNILRELKNQNERLEEQKKMIQTGQYIEQLAREKLNMLKPGEWSVIDKKEK